MLQQTSRTGAAAVSRRAQRNPLEVLVSLVEADPSAGVDRLFSKWEDAIRTDEDLLEAALRHTFTNLLSCIDRDGRARKRRTVPEKIAAKGVAVAAQVQSIALMNVVLPNGKTLRESKFKDCARAGGWFAAIAKMGKPDQIVGRTISEADLRKVPLK